MRPTDAPIRPRQNSESSPLRSLRLVVVAGPNLDLRFGTQGFGETNAAVSVERCAQETVVLGEDARVLGPMLPQQARRPVESVNRNVAVDDVPLLLLIGTLSGGTGSSGRSV